MRATSGPIRYLALAIAVAIAWPANIPLGMDEAEAPRAQQLIELAGAVPGQAQAETITVQSLTSRLAWQGLAHPLRDDQMEESDEGDDHDDSRHCSYWIASVFAVDLPSLIPSGNRPARPQFAKSWSPLVAPCRLRC